jgi:choline dehydrogenase-like flavoprotein
VEVRRREAIVRYVRPQAGEGVVRGRTVVLAANAIETPKLMLMSLAPTHPDGLGNGHDLVGRYLMDHPLQLSWAVAREPLHSFRGPFSTSGVEALRDGPFRTTYGAFRTEIGNDGWLWPAGDPTVQATKAAREGRFGKDAYNDLRDHLARQVRLASLVEQLPDPENRITLANERDEIGIPRPRINYRIDDYSRAALRKARDVHERLFGALGVSSIEHAAEALSPSHPMGTCRMGDDPTTSVVDSLLRVHGAPNCFVLGSAVFPTGTAANPTLTIAALSLRAASAIERSLSCS